MRKLFFILIYLSAFQLQAQKPQIGYMTKVPLSQVFSIAKYEEKPVMIFVHSFSCYSSRKYIREIMNKKSISERFKNNFVCSNADMSTARGRSIALKYNVLILPVIILINSDHSIIYRCEMKIDEGHLIDEIDNFVTVNKVQRQIKNYMKSSRLTLKLSAEAIGASYAKIDFKKSTESNPRTKVKKYTMSITELKPFEEGYIQEWDKLLANKSKKEAASH